MDDRADPLTASLSIEEFVLELGRLRTEAGSPSYAELARRVARRREAAGVPPERAVVARSTIYDVFRPGRRRLDAGLVVEILQALQLDDSAVDHWAAVGRRAVPTQAGAAPDGGTAAPASGPTAQHRRRSALLFIAGCVVMNLLGRAVADLLDLPLHLDMVGTATAAVVLGPWWGAAAGLLTNGLGGLLSGPESLPFALVNVTGALVWGYGVHRFGMGRTVLRFLVLNLLCGTACSLVAVPLLLLLYGGGGIRPGLENVTETVYVLTHLLGLSVFVSNLVLSLADKTISGFVALAVAESRSEPLSQQRSPVSA